MSIDRRDFLKAATAGAGLAIAGAPIPSAASPSPRQAPFVRSGQLPDVVVIGAGNFGAWTALNLQRGGARVTLIDPDFDNVWLAGGGSAESFKQGPVLGQYIAGRVFGTENDEALNDTFRLLEGEFDEGGTGLGDEFGQKY